MVLPASRDICDLALDGLLAIHEAGTQRCARLPECLRADRHPRPTKRASSRDRCGDHVVGSNGQRIGFGSAQTVLRNEPVDTHPNVVTFASCCHPSPSSNWPLVDWEVTVAEQLDGSRSWAAQPDLERPGVVHVARWCKRHLDRAIRRATRLDGVQPVFTRLGREHPALVVDDYELHRGWRCERFDEHVLVFRITDEGAAEVERIRRVDLEGYSYSTESRSEERRVGTE